jgi:thiamine-phosphate pyrophosphorylase
MKNKIEDRFGFYSVLTNPIRGYDYLTNLLVDNEIKFVQLRTKSSDRFENLKIAELMKKITEGTSTNLIINDDAQIALDSSADGVHLGQGDMTIAEARALVGDDMIIGLSTHNPTETKNSCDEQIDYIGVGPVYKTPTKDIPDPVLGLETMAEMVNLSKVPAVCIGGISFDRVPDILKAGGRNFSLVRPLCSVEDPQKNLKELLEIIGRFES